MSDLEVGPTPLQAARRELGWKQSRVLSALAAAASAEGVTIAGQASLKTMLSRWENGNGQPDPTYQRLFCQVYDREPEDLGFAATPTRLSRSRVTPVVDEETVDYFSAVFKQHVRADQLMGPQHLVDVVRAQAELLDRILPDAKHGPIRQELVRLSCLYNEFTGWLYQDAGDPDSALLFTERATDRAIALDEAANSVYLLMRKSNIASDSGRPERAVMMADAAVGLMPKVTPQIRALVLVQQARAHALRGAMVESLRALEAAMREVHRPNAEPHALSTYCTPEYVAMESAASWAKLGQSTLAIPVLERALKTWPATQRRDQGLCQARLAHAYAAIREPERAAQIGHQAVATVRTAMSARAVRELGGVRETLMPWRRQQDVAELMNLIKGLARAA